MANKLAKTSSQLPVIPEWAMALVYIGVGIWSVDKLVKLVSGPGLKVPNPIVGAVGTTMIGYLYSLIQQATQSTR